MLPQVRCMASRERGVPGVLGNSHPMLGWGAEEARGALVWGGPRGIPWPRPNARRVDCGGWGVSLDRTPRDTGTAPEAVHKPPTLTASLGRQLPSLPRLTDAETEA